MGYELLGPGPKEKAEAPFSPTACMRATVSRLQPQPVALDQDGTFGLELKIFARTLYWQDHRLHLDDVIEAERQHLTDLIEQNADPRSIMTEVNLVFSQITALGPQLVEVAREKQAVKKVKLTIQEKLQMRGKLAPFRWAVKKEGKESVLYARSDDELCDRVNLNQMLKSDKPALRNFALTYHALSVRHQYLERALFNYAAHVIPEEDQGAELLDFDDVKVPLAFIAVIDAVTEGGLQDKIPLYLQSFYNKVTNRHTLAAAFAHQAACPGSNRTEYQTAFRRLNNLKQLSPSFDLLQDRQPELRLPSVLLSGPELSKAYLRSRMDQNKKQLGEAELQLLMVKSIQEGADIADVVEIARAIYPNYILHDQHGEPHHIFEFALMHPKDIFRFHDAESVGLLSLRLLAMKGYRDQLKQLGLDSDNPYVRYYDFIYSLASIQAAYLGADIVQRSPIREFLSQRQSIYEEDVVRESAVKKRLANLKEVRKNLTEDTGIRLSRLDKTFVGPFHEYENVHDLPVKEDLIKMLMLYLEACPTISQDDHQRLQIIADKLQADPTRYNSRLQI